MPVLPFWIYTLIAYKNDAILEKKMIQNIILQSKHKIVQEEYTYFKLSQSQQEL